MNTNNKNGYYHGKYYIDGKEVELPDDIKKIFEEARKAEQRILRQERRYGVYTSSNYMLKSKEQDWSSKEDYIESLEDKTSNIEEKILKNEEILMVKESFSELDKEELRLIKLLIEQELTEREIGKILGISQVAVNKRKHKVFDKLRTLLKGLMTIFM